MVASGWSGYFVQLLYSMGIYFPLSLAGAPGTIVTVSATISGNGSFNLLAFIVVLAVTALLCFGIAESSKANMVVVVIKLVVLILFILVGFSFIDNSNYSPFVPPNTGQFGVFGFSGVIRGAGKIFFAYIGFDSVSTAAQEANNPQRDLPIGILGSLALCTILYIFTTLVLTGMTHYSLLNVSHPLSFAMEQHGVNWLTPIISVGALCGLSSVMLVSLLAQTRIFYSMSVDGLLPPFFSELNPVYKTPIISTIATGTLTAFIAALVPLDVLSEMTSMGTLLAFIMVCVGVILLRYNEPELPRAFLCPWMPWIPIMGALICFLQMVFLGWQTWIRLIVWLLIGLMWYFFYASHHAVGARMLKQMHLVDANSRKLSVSKFTRLEDLSTAVIVESKESIEEALSSTPIPDEEEIKEATEMKRLHSQHSLESL